jgi:hypothetical protein
MAAIVTRCGAATISSFRSASLLKVSAIDILTIRFYHQVAESSGNVMQATAIGPERYAWLRVMPCAAPLAAHEHAGESHPLLWAREYRGPRVVADLLGRDERSYDSPRRRLLVARRCWG